MRIAVVGIGTNSTRLLIAETDSEDDIRVIKTGLVITRLGEGIGKGAYLLKPAMDRTLQALLTFNQIIQNTCPDKIIVGATSAVREADNRSEFLMKVKEQVGWEVCVLSGTEEAELSYLGIVRGLKPNIQHLAVIDIGGGSTEFIWAKENGLSYVSVKLGAVRMTESDYGIAGIKEMLAELLASISADGIKGLIGVGGTLTTLAAIDLQLDVLDPVKVHGYFLKRQRVKDILQQLEGMSLEERKKIPGLQPQRADIIIAGVRIAVTIMEGLEVDGVTVSQSDIMYGLLYRELDQKLNSTENI